MKKIISFILTALFIAMVLPSSVSAQDQRVFSWYCVHRGDSKQPSCDPSMKFIEELGGYYIDKSHGDNSDEKVIYLTFDAGYENGNIEKILNILKSEDVKGAFFILSNLVDKETELVLRMADEGHLVCNHTSRHRDMTSVESIEAFKAELDALENLYYEKTGRRLDRYYRPPEGKFTESNLRMANELGYKTVFWSFAYADWDNSHQMSAEAATKKILSNVHNGEIMLLHPTSATNAKILKNVIQALKAQGYRFGTLDELTGK